jgi:hypothetical protein
MLKYWHWEGALQLGFLLNSETRQQRFVWEARERTYRHPENLQGLFDIHYDEK